MWLEIKIHHPLKPHLIMYHLHKNRYIHTPLKNNQLRFVNKISAHGRISIKT